jgi:uncharacterized protein HemX
VADAAEPDEDTVEQAIVAPPLEPAPPAAPAAPVQRHGAGAGGRWLALLAILLTIAAATIVVWWSLGR